MNQDLSLSSTYEDRQKRIFTKNCNLVDLTLINRGIFKTIYPGEGGVIITLPKIDHFNGFLNSVFTGA